jgi:hypothetical protein
MSVVSTNTNLGGNATYTSGTYNTDRGDTISGIVKSDQSGTLLIEQSFDGTNWDLSKSIAVTGGTGTAISESSVAPYYRLKYTNGATPQGSSLRRWNLKWR